MSVSSGSNLVTGQPAAKGRKGREGRSNTEYRKLNCIQDRILNTEYRILNCTEYKILNVEYGSILNCIEYKIPNIGYLIHRIQYIEGNSTEH